MEYWFIRMKSRTEYRYWNEFNQYEHWLIDNDLLNSRECYCLTHKICDEYVVVSFKQVKSNESESIELL